MTSTPDSKLKPRKRPAMPPNDTSKSTQPKRTSRLYLIIGHVRYSTLIYVSNGFNGSVPDLFVLYQRIQFNVIQWILCCDNGQLTFYSISRYHRPYSSSSIRIYCNHGPRLYLVHIWLNNQFDPIGNMASMLNKITKYIHIFTISSINLFSDHPITNWWIEWCNATAKFHRFFHSTFFHATGERVFFGVVVQFYLIWKYAFTLSDAQLFGVLGSVCLF